VAGEQPERPTLRSVLADQPAPVDPPDRPDHPLRSLLADPVPLPIDPLPVAPEPIPVPADPGSEVPPPPGPPAPGTVRDAVTPAGDGPVATVPGHDPALLRRGNG
jgi:hypothetical protein